MKNSPLTVVVLFAFIFPALVRAADVPAVPAASPYASLESLVGGTWVAKLPPQKDRPTMRLELRFAWNENKQGLRFDSTWFINEKPSPYTSGMYAWNAAKKSLVMFYTDASGALTEGGVTPEGNVLAHELTLTNKNGTVENIRVRLTKLADDAFTNEIFTQKDGAWSKFIEVRYERRS